MSGGGWTWRGEAISKNDSRQMKDMKHGNEVKKKRKQIFLYEANPHETNLSICKYF